MLSCHRNGQFIEGLPLSPSLQMLKNEHVALNDQKQTIYDQSRSLISSISKGIYKVEALIDLRDNVQIFFKELHIHSEKEEEYLFNMMAVHMDRHSGPLAVMEFEHEEAKRLINQFLVNTEQSEDGRDTTAAIENCRLIIEAYHVLSSHFMKEEQVLFPMAENVLTDEQKEDLWRHVASAS
ncbi:hemerythrin domain-containing protein [Bacillus sp. P14.5]|uniref:hemerythrin domain-containing protein n=1 Tax=Bacillus sp. P14.5 TaxID=1983400 RepID=UPI000DEA1624|nr:hemerythrin domain-containing protein [Bacillus sp. P14.5]